eukprot:4656591-Pyramimonas_sp.AAC.1
MSHFLSMIEVAATAGLFVMLDNPASSRLWLLPQLLDLVTRFNAKFQRVDYCQCQAPWRKATIFLSSNCPELEKVLCVCDGIQARCSATGRAHISLRGKDSQ